MEPFIMHKGRVATMDRANVDTDQIIPKQFLKRIERTGFGQFLFWDWRFDDDGQENPEFELNRKEFSGASILVARRNFGSGSSREHAVWALEDYGFRVVLAPSFADIFFNNCFKNGVLPVVLDEDVISDIFDRVAAKEDYHLTVSLENLQVVDSDGMCVDFEVDNARRQRMLEGLDDIAMTLQSEKLITQYEADHGIA
ncbi:MAG: 3-isopropylmalate dehydratase small subunit [Pirellulaceae bacterium]|nr:3-isopropylmalate dehydratase small subunit [Pirellulaceae bacterium]